MHAFDLENRTLLFAKRIIRMCKVLVNSPINNRLIGQVIGSAGSVGANYREANDALGKKDFVMRMKIARKEAKECLHWLELIAEANPHLSNKMTDILNECRQLQKIFSAIINKCSQ